MQTETVFGRAYSVLKYRDIVQKVSIFLTCIKPAPLLTLNIQNCTLHAAFKFLNVI